MVLIKFKKFPLSIKHTIFIVIFLSVTVHINVWLIKIIMKYLNNMKMINSKTNRNYGRIKMDTKFKRILSWDNYYQLIRDDESVLDNLGCEVSECKFIAKGNLLLDHYTEFDAIVFSEEVLKSIKDLPMNRSRSQLYVFATIESSYNHPACELIFDEYFNWTFTYRLDSDIVFNYFVVKDKIGNTVAPSETVRWDVSLEPVKEEVKSILMRKKKAATWLVSNCRADSFRDDYMTALQEHLHQYALRIDVFGKCSHRQCSYEGACEKMIKEDYYFYMAFENSISDDYVTEKVLHGYDNYAVPVVFGGANYSRYLPKGSYINAREIHPYNLAYKIYEAVHNYDILEKYFAYTNIYTVSSEFKAEHPLCKFCAAINGGRARNSPAKKLFRRWWNGMKGMKWCLSSDYWNETMNINVDFKHLFKLYDI